MVIGEHGENMLPLVRFSSISGIPLSSFINNVQSNEFVTKTRNVAGEVISLKGATVYAPGNAVSAMIDAISGNRRKILPVSAFLEGEYGYSNVCLGVPCVLGSNGIEKIIELDLNPEEKEMLTNGVESVKTAIRELPI